MYAHCVAFKKVHMAAILDFLLSATLGPTF